MSRCNVRQHVRHASPVCDTKTASHVSRSCQRSHARRRRTEFYRCHLLPVAAAGGASQDRGPMMQGGMSRAVLHSVAFEEQGISLAKRAFRGDIRCCTALLGRRKCATIVHYPYEHAGCRGQRCPSGLGHGPSGHPNRGRHGSAAVHRRPAPASGCRRGTSAPAMPDRGCPSRHAACHGGIPWPLRPSDEQHGDWVFASFALDKAQEER